MTNEELAERVRDGDRAALLELWRQVERFAYGQARRWTGYGEMDDLMQAAFLALLEAVEGYDSSAGKFTTWYGLALKGAFTAATGQRTKRERLDPLRSAVSLDDVLEDRLLEEVIPDPEAEAAFQEVEERDRRERLRTLVAELLAELPEPQRAAVVGKYWYGQRVDPAAHAAALRYLRHPARSRRLKAFF